MARNNTNLETNKDIVPAELESSLKGTFIFVMLLGLFIVGSWSAMFWIFLDRM